MAYFSQEKKARIAPVVKALLNKYGLKGSLSVDNHSTVCLTIKSGRIDFMGNAYEVMKENEWKRNPSWGPVERPTHLGVNQYHLGMTHSGVALEFLEKAIAALKGADWYDRSDAMTDYFDTAYYIDIRIGKWDKPYEYTP